jgi:hypothetical protein
MYTDLTCGLINRRSADQPNSRLMPSVPNQRIRYHGNILVFFEPRTAKG